MDQPQRCRARSKGTGKQCRRFVTPGYNVCYYHGANPGNHGGAPRGNQNALKYGAYVNKLLNKAEETVFLEFYQDLQRDFGLNKSSDRMLAETTCLTFVKLLRAVRSGNAEAMYKMDLLFSNQMRDLKAARDETKIAQAKWASNLLEKYGSNRKAQIDSGKQVSSIKDKE